jgi:hypothetical protein
LYIAPNCNPSRSAISADSSNTSIDSQRGDKGGKKDREKNKQQQLTKQKQEEQNKHDKAPAKKPTAGTA